MEEIIQLKISLIGSKPVIWRRVLVNGKMTFQELHCVIQLSMGWTNSHLHEFVVNRTRISEPFEDIEDEFNEDLVDSSTVTLENEIAKGINSFIYIYDFGDYWEHKVTVEKFLPVNEKIKYPTCVAGKKKCPPDDCGGIYGFSNLLKTISNKNDPEHEDMLEWLGGEYDPDYFDLSEINHDLSGLNEFMRESQEP